MADEIPDLTGEQLIKYLTKDGWIIKRRATHGIRLSKKFADRVRVTVVPTHKGTLPPGTLGAILGPKQTNIGRDGLVEIIKRHG